MVPSGKGGDVHLALRGQFPWVWKASGGAVSAVIFILCDTCDGDADDVVDCHTKGYDLFLRSATADWPRGEGVCYQSSDDNPIIGKELSCLRPPRHKSSYNGKDCKDRENSTDSHNGFGSSIDSLTVSHNC